MLKAQPQLIAGLRILRQQFGEARIAGCGDIEMAQFGIDVAARRLDLRQIVALGTGLGAIQFFQRLLLFPFRCNETASASERKAASLLVSSGSAVATFPDCSLFSA